MKIKFTENLYIWKTGDIVDVEVKYLEKNKILINNIAIIDLHLLLKHCEILSESEE